MDDPMRMVFDKDNLEYILRVHCRLRKSEIVKMSMIDALRWAYRATSDLLINRADTYLRPLAEMMPPLVQRYQLKGVYSSSIPSLIKHSTAPMRMNFKFPKDWI